MYTNVLKLVYVYGELLHVSANHMAIFGDCLALLFYTRKYGHMVGRNMPLIVYVN